MSSPVIFGEVLFDVFPDAVVLGGAPINVAWHLTGFGASPLLISRIGADDNGAKVLAAMRGWGMDTSGMQSDEGHPTGVVRIETNGASHRFDIQDDQAYDYIDRKQALAACAKARPSLLYHGTLGVRHEVSRHALNGLRQLPGIRTFVDVNLRDPWWQPAFAEQIISSATWVKLNDEELVTLTGTAADSENALAELAGAYARHHELELLIVTCGARGALAITPGGLLRASPAPVTQLVDTVGAGDAFSAVTLLGLLHGWPLQTTIDRANGFAATVCTLRGATSGDPVPYAGLSQAWSS